MNADLHRLDGGGGRPSRRGDRRRRRRRSRASSSSSAQEDLLRRRRPQAHDRRPRRPTPRRCSTKSSAIKATLRKLETIGKPVVAAINGAALGGGLEIALATHHRIAVGGPLRDRPARGHPRPAARRRWRHAHRAHVRHPGRADERPAAGPAHQARQGARERPRRRDRRRAGRAARRPHARGSRPTPATRRPRTQPWDREGYRIPGGTPSNPKLAAFLPGVPGQPAQAGQGCAVQARRATS